MSEDQETSEEIEEEEENPEFITVDCSVCGTSFERQTAKNVYTPCPECKRLRDKEKSDISKYHRNVKRLVKQGIVPEGQGTLVNGSERELPPDAVMRRDQLRREKAQRRQEKQSLDGGSLPEEQTSLEKFGIKNRRRPKYPR